MHRSEQRRAAVVALYQADATDRTARDLLDPRATIFTRELVDGVEGDRVRVDTRSGEYVSRA